MEPGQERSPWTRRRSRQWARMGLDRRRSSARSPSSGFPLTMKKRGETNHSPDGRSPSGGFAKRFNNAAAVRGLPRSAAGEVPFDEHRQHRDEDDSEDDDVEV